VTAERSSEILIDALNVAWWCGAPPSLRFSVALLVALLRRGDRAQLYFDASAPHQLSHERDVYEDLLAMTGHVVQAPSRTPADRLLLRHARDRSALIVSRDRFRDHRIRYRRIIDDPARVLSGHVEADTLCVPGLDLVAPLPASARDAVDAVRGR
jgi:hypothetical protein